MIRAIAAIVVICLALAGGCHSPGESAQNVVCGVVPADWPAGQAHPVAVPLPSGLQQEPALVARIQIEGSSGFRQVPAQIEPGGIAGDQPRAWVLIAASADDRGRKIAVRLAPGSPTGHLATSAHYDDPQVVVDSVLKYWQGTPSGNYRYPFTDYIHPVWGLDGEILTDLAPKDHLHHRGVFWAWVRHQAAGRPLGNWWVPNSGIACEPGAVRTTTGLVFAGFAASHFLKAVNKDGSPGEVAVRDRSYCQGRGRVLRDDVVCRVFPETKAGRAIDVDLTLVALADNVRIGGTLSLDKGYGGMTVRFAPAKDIRIVADGKPLAGDGVRQRACWADLTGIFTGPDGKPLPHRSGIALLVYPSHPDYPPEWLMRFYGVLNVSWPGLNLAEVPKDKPVRLGYRLLIHRGDAREADVEAQYRVFTADWKWQVAAEGAGDALQSRPL